MAFRSPEFSERIKAIREFAVFVPAEFAGDFTAAVNGAVGSVDNYDLDAQKAADAAKDLAARIDAFVATP